MDNKYGEQFIIMQAAIKANKKDYDDKILKLTEDFKAMLAAITDQINTLEYFPT